MINVKGVVFVAALFCILLLFRMARQKWWALRKRWSERRK
jgi:hypothetical protein